MKNYNIQAVKVVFTDQDSNALLIRRTESAPRRAGMFDLPGGLIDTSDFRTAGLLGWRSANPWQVASARELKEETGFVDARPERFELGEVKLLDIGGKLGKIMVASMYVEGYKFEPRFTPHFDEATGSYIQEHDQVKWIPREELGKTTDIEVFWPILTD